jgi:hypothetical protein
MEESRIKGKLIILLFVCFFISGCAVNDKLGWLDDKFSIFFEDNFKKVKKYESEYASFQKDFELNAEKISLIEKYLEENNLNRYGDPQDTFYMGGTPLFDEKTGKKIDRFEYIIDKQPEILNILQ